MDIIIDNLNKDILDQFTVPTIERMHGVFTAEEIVSKFKNLGYNKIIIDITAIKGYQNVENIRKLAVNLDPSKIIILLYKSDDRTKDTTNNTYLSKLVSVRIDNFTMDLRGLEYLYANPNSFIDTIQYQNINAVASNQSPIGLRPLNQTNEFLNTSVPEKVVQKKIIGLKKVTSHPGATTLAYMMKKILDKNYNVAAIEIDNDDFRYFKDSDLISTTSDNVEDIVKNNASEVIIIDLNRNTEAESLCDEILYILEPSIIKLNKLLANNPTIINDLMNKKVVLSPSLLSEKDVKEFESESGLHIFYNLAPFNDRLNSEEVHKLLAKLNLQ